jgi:hypothetical protein
VSGRPDAGLTVSEAFAVLGLPGSATLTEVRAARRRLAHALHPDHGGDPAAMREVNRAFDVAVRTLLQPPKGGPAGEAAATDQAAPAGDTTASATAAATAGAGRPASGPTRRSRSVQQDAPSFSMDALPAEAFEVLLIVTNWVGEVLVEDPPYVMEVFLREPAPCWCRLELLPEAGASMVSLTVAGIEGEEVPLVEEVRDQFIALINELGGLPE